MSVATVTLIRVADGVEVQTEGYAVGSGTGQHDFEFYERRWREEGSLLASDSDTLTAVTAYGDTYTRVVRWAAS